MQFEIGKRVYPIQKTVGSHKYDQDRIIKYYKSKRSRACKLLNKKDFFYIIKYTNDEVVSCGDLEYGKGDYFHLNDLRLYEPIDGKQFLLDFENDRK